MKINFKCPWCNGTELHQVRRFVTISQRVENITINSMSLSADYDIVGGNAPHFECKQCGTAIHANDKPVTEIKDLFEVLQTCEMLEDECPTTTEK